MIVFGFFENILKENDEVILSKSEHASNILPWYILSLKKKIKLKFIPLDEDNKITIQNLLKTITDKTRVISLAHITNVVGDIRDINKIIEIAHSNNIYTVVDASQSIPHIKTNIKEMDPDFSVDSEEDWISIIVDEEKKKVMDVLSSLQNIGNVRDIKVEEISTEEVVKRIYEGGT